MRIWAKGPVLSIYLNDQKGWFYDRAGRLFAAWDGGWYISLGLSGRAVARRWQDQRREVRSLTDAEIERLNIFAREALVDAALAFRRRGISVHWDIKSPSDFETWLWKAIAFDREKDSKRFHDVYGRVGILPPDQYDSTVIQTTDGCRWNQCSFCHFYKSRPFTLRSHDAILAHMLKVSDFLGAGLERRRSIFLGEANALAAPLESLKKVMKSARASLVPHIPDFRGFFSFIEPSDCACDSAADFRALAKAGLKRVYYGLETGNAELRERLKKPGTLKKLGQSIKNAKEGGVLTSLILLVGAGGRAWADRHLEQSVKFLTHLPLDNRDLIYLSPLRGSDRTGGTVMTVDELETEMKRWRTTLPRGLRIAPYDIREFVY